MLFRQPTPSSRTQPCVARIISKLTLVAGLLAASHSHALGLGELSSTSFLGQPLEASIDVLLDGEDYGPEDIRVRQLNNVEASNLGIDLAGYQSYYRLTPTLDNGRLKVKLISRQPVNEPFLNMLVELKWPKGTVYREYTVFLDPITLQQSSGQPLGPEPAKPVAIKTSPSKPAAKTIDIQPGAATYRVRSGDSLSKIASRLVGGTQTSRRDVMQWLLENNPRAFINGEMNRLLAGVTLKLPTAKPATAPASAETTERLSIVTPMAAQAGTAKGKDADTDNLKALKTQMAVTNEVVDRLTRENEAMRLRLIAIEKSGYVESLERLVMLKEEEITTLQAQLATKNQPNTEPAAKPPVTPPEPQAPAVEKTEPSSDDANTIQQLWMAIMLLLAAMAGMLFFLLRWRAQPASASSTKAADIQQESELLQELDDIIDSQSAFDITANTAASYKDDDKDVFETINQPLVNRFNRRPDDIVKQSIQAKTQTYSPPALQEHDKNYHDEVDELISDAIEAANRGAFDVAEALLVAERTHQARDPSGDRGDIDSRIELALEFVEQLRQGQHSAG